MWLKSFMLPSGWNHSSAVASEGSQRKRERTIKWNNMKKKKIEKKIGAEPKRKTGEFSGVIYASLIWCE